MLDRIRANIKPNNAEAVTKTVRQPTAGAVHLELEKTLHSKSDFA